ncbi:DNA-directed RNA polymerase subunit omega [Amygdalobacter nucleatus]|uniref:DNA-directed RNA polymerase subunit omega n=1 Tax=Amygdalobacter nucleatus TaxID=3029274 RepID=A0A133YG91_9FIRM|nr:DNA-directed RNA polymerase subunit omega [Amygdalobacter nucleatus]KXB42206.1 DNA-directed RNA polymerase, omega subunit [Amygdalobacter nucleatus]MDF0486412.1 DNA-directed RNA polymerase subunit omega [Amygdalobacter nucleatus]
MLVDPPIEKLLKHVENRYCLAIAISKRSRQLVNGGLPLLKTDSKNEVSVACEEFADDTVVAVMQPVRPAIPLKPEVVARKRQEREQRFQDMEEKANAETFVKPTEAIAPAAEAENEPEPNSDVMDQANTESLEDMISAELDDEDADSNEYDE